MDIYSNFKKYLTLLVESLNIIFLSADREKQFTLFGAVFYAVRYINPKAKIRKFMRSKLSFVDKKRIKRR